MYCGLIKVLTDQTAQGLKERELILTLRKRFSLRCLVCVCERECVCVCSIVPQDPECVHHVPDVSHWLEMVVHSA